MPVPVTLVISGVVAPALVATLVMLLWNGVLALRGARHESGDPGQFTRPRPLDRVSRRAGAPLALMSGLIASHVCAFGWPTWPAEPHKWIPFIAAGSLAMLAMETSAAASAWVRWFMKAAFVAASAWLVLRPYPTNTWTFREDAIWIGGLTGGTLLLEACLLRTARNASGAAQSTLLAIPCTVAVIVLFSAGSATLAMMAAALGSILLVMTVLGALGVPIRSADVAHMIPVLLICLLAIGYFNDFTGLPSSSFLLVGGAPFAALAIPARFARQRPAWARLLRLIAVSIPAGCGTLLAWRTYTSLGGSLL